MKNYNFFIFLFATLLFANISMKAQGPVIISGLDTEYGVRTWPTGGNTSHGTLQMWRDVIQTGIINNLATPWNTTGPILVIGGGKNVTDEMTMFWDNIAFNLGRTVQYSNISTGDIATINFNGFAMIAICNTAAGSGSLTLAELNQISTRQADIAAFVNSGHGLFASSCNIGAPPYGYINIGTPPLITGNSNSPNSTPTAAGVTMGIPGIGGPFHNYFTQWPSFLSVLSTVSVPGNPTAACILGGVRVTIPGEVNFCCVGRNLVTNGAFSAGNTGFTSNYTSITPVLPRRYHIVNAAGALADCAGWVVADHTTCNGNGNFMVVNGQTNQTVNAANIIWRQNVTGTFQKDSTYKFCAFFKHLPQCYFDVPPRVRLEVAGYTPGGWTQITTGVLPCDWQNINFTFVPTVTATNVTLRIRLDHINSGDGNDLAIDDISLMQLPAIPGLGMFVSMQNNSQVTASINSSLTTDDNLPSGCKHVWTVARATSINFGTTPPTVTGIANQQSLSTWGGTTTFPPYVFGQNFYLITLSVNDCDCYAKTKIAKLIGPASSLRSASGPNSSLPNGVSVQLSAAIIKKYFPK